MSRDDRIPHDRAADAAAYAVGALEREEAEEYRRHLDRCTECRDELAAFQRIADALPMAAPRYPPPPALRRRLLRAVEAEPRRLETAAPVPRRYTPRLPRALGAQAALAAVAGVAIVVALIGAVRLHPGRSTGSRVLPARVVSAPGTAQLRITAGHAQLMVRHLPPPAAGRIYEVWLRRGNQAPAPTNALFSVTAGGAADIGVPGGLDGVREILVTQEPAGGSRVPTGPAVIVAATG
jgi:anti-sigma-K factor RskA